MEKKNLLYNFHIWKNAYLIDFIQFSVRMELYEIVWSEVFHIWKFYAKKFWSTKIYKFKSSFFTIFAEIFDSLKGTEKKNSTLCFHRLN